MTDDLVKRLRDGCSCDIDSSPCMAEEECRDAFAAAARIEQLEAERNAAYIFGLEDAAKIAEAEGGIPDNSGSAPSDFAASGYNEACIDIAAAIRAKIKGRDDE